MGSQTTAAIPSIQGLRKPLADCLPLGYRILSVAGKEVRPVAKICLACDGVNDVLWDTGHTAMGDAQRRRCAVGGYLDVVDHRAGAGVRGLGNLAAEGRPNLAVAHEQKVHQRKDADNLDQ